MNVEKWLSDGFKFGFNFRRAGAWAAFLLVASLVFIVAAVLIGVANYGQMTTLLAQNPAGFSAAVPGVAFQLLIAMVIVGIAAGLFFVLLSLSTYFAARDFVSTGSASLRKGFAEAKTRYVSFLAAIVLTFVISCCLMLLQSIPAIGFLLYILAVILVSFSLTFWSTYFSCRGLGAVESLKASFGLFKRKPLSVAIVLIAYLVSIIVLLIAWLVLLLLVALIGALLTAAFSLLGAAFAIIGGVFIAVSVAFFFLFGFGFFVLYQTGFMTSAFFELDSKEKPAVVVRAKPIVAASKQFAVKRFAKKTVRR